MKYKVVLAEENELLQESSLSRILSKMESYDCGIITAFRHNFSKKKNLDRNKKLLANIYYHKFDATTVYGSYIEDFDPNNKEQHKEVTEESFFIVDSKNTGNLKKFLTLAGSIFLQDSIIFIPKNTKTAILIGTTPWRDNTNVWPEKGQEIVFPKMKIGTENEFMTKVKNRPFYFHEKTSPCKLHKPINMREAMVVYHFADKTLKEQMK